MKPRRNDYDITNRIQTTDLLSVESEITRIFRVLYPGVAHDSMSRAFRDIGLLYSGAHPDYHACDTGYHDLQHVMDVTLAMSRLMDGYERARTNTPALGVKVFQLGIITALFHDMGYLRKMDDTVAQNGAFYTLSHVSRGAAFLRQYLSTVGLAEFAEAGAELIHFTGFEKRVAEILIDDPLLRLLGSLLGSADIIAQLADRCYLEKCRDRLYPEFVAGGIAENKDAAGNRNIVYSSGEDLVHKTPIFFESAIKRLESDLGGAYNYAAAHFGGFNLYFHEATKNVHFAK
ncbi:MAG: hypothetical protein WCL29_07810, partial [Pseudomonadota bacterium]